MRAKINYAGPWITEKEVEYVNEALLNGFYQNYRVHKTRLEEKVCEVTGAKFALATTTCTAAIHLAVAAAGIKPGDEVITTDASCVASALPIAYCGATAVFVDVDPNTWCISPNAIRRAITPQTRAILPVHWNGHPCHMDEIMAIAREHNLLVIEDGAPAMGARYKRKMVGTFGVAGCFSFQGAKVAIGGQGGILITSDEKFYEQACIYASFGRTDSAMQYWSDVVGFNYGMANLPAALALAQMERLDELLAKKRQIFHMYKNGLEGAEHIKLIEELPGTISTYCYPIMLLQENARLPRQAIFEELKKDNIDAHPAQPRISGMPMFQRRTDNPVAKLVETRGIILPAAFNVTEDDIKFVCQRLRGLI